MAVYLPPGFQADVSRALVEVVGCAPDRADALAARAVPAGLARDLERARRWPFHRTDGIAATARRVAAVIAGREDEGFHTSRTAELCEALAGLDLALRDDSAFCEAYIKGETASPPQEVAAVMALSNRLVETHGGRVRRRSAPRIEGRMRQIHASRTVSWSEVLSDVVQDV